MSLGELRVPGEVKRVAVAVTRGDSPRIVLASDADLLGRALALEVVAATPPSSLDPHQVDVIREALLEERWADAVFAWMDATGEIVDAYPDEPVWTEQQLSLERTALELRMAPLFRG